MIAGFRSSLSRAFRRTSRLQQHIASRHSDCSAESTTAPYRHTCVWCRQPTWSAPTWLVRAVGAERGRDEVDVKHVADVVAGTLLVKACRGFRAVEVARKDLGFVPRSRRGRAARMSGTCAYLRHAPAGGDHEAVRSRPRRTQSCEPTTPSWWVMPILELRRGRARHHAASLARQRISPSRRP